MMATTDAPRTASACAGVSPSELRWVSHPVLAPGAARKNLLLTAVIALAALAVLDLTGNLGWALISAALLLLGVHDYLLPTTFAFDAEGVSSRSPIFRRRKPWSALKSFQSDPNGVLLSPLPSQSRLEAYRGLYVRFAGNRHAVLAVVRDRLPPSRPKK